jgi:BASS family bile acid:Na+ symporter
MVGLAVGYPLIFQQSHILFSTPELLSSMRLGPPSMGAIVIMIVNALLIGHLIGGPQAQQRSALTTASVARNFGLALFIAGLTPEGQASSMTLVVYLLIGVAIATPYALWMKRHSTTAS